jgi:hypothetical protein
LLNPAVDLLRSGRTARLIMHKPMATGIGSCHHLDAAMSNLPKGNSQRKTPSNRDQLSSSRVLDRTVDISTPSHPVRIVPRPMRKPPKALCMNGRALNEKDHRSVSFYAPSAVFDRAADIITPFHAQ